MLHIPAIGAQAARLLRYCRRLATQPGSVTLDSYRLLVPDICSGRARRSIYAELYESSEVKAVKKFIRGDDVVVEAGTALGYLSLHIAAIVGSDRLHTIEGNRELIPHVQDNFRINGLPAPHLHHGLASASGPTTRPFNVSREIWSSSVLDRGNTEKVEIVPCIDLDEMLSTTGATVLVCDIEGGECELIKECRFPGLATIIMELHPWLFSGLDVEGAVSLLNERGFQLEDIVDGKVYVFTRHEFQD